MLPLMLATKDNKKKTRFIASAEAHTYVNANRFAVSKKRDGVWGWFACGEPSPDTVSLIAACSKKT